MASIGPQLPPHHQKRKRTPEDDADLGSPPPKTSRRDNDDKIPLDDDSDDDFGPSAPDPANNDSRDKARSGPKPAIGPSLPPSVAKENTAAPERKRQSIGPSMPPTAAPANNDEIPLDSDDDDDATGPAPPPTTTGPAPPPKRVLGPAPPPAPLSERPTTNPDSDSSDDDDWGPALPGASSSNSRSTTTHGPTLPSTAHQPEPAAPKRDDWMLAPPTNGAYRAPDPTKLKARKFASGPRAATDAKPAGGISSIWTETPEEKARRLANAVLGREDPNAPSSQPVGPSRPEAASNAGGSNKADEARIRSYTEQTRGKSLVEQHQAARAAGKSAAAAAATRVKGDNGKWGGKGGGEGGEDDEDDPSKRAFDWEKDMKVGGRISNSQRKELLNRAANFGGRFQSGKYL